jgi:hypothetical protein
MFQTKVVGNIKSHISCSITSFPKVVHFTRYVIEYITARQTTDDNIIRRTHFAHWITNAADTHRQHMKYFLLFHVNNGHANAPYTHIVTFLQSVITLWWTQKSCEVGAMLASLTLGS